MRDQYLRSLLPHGDQTITGQLEKRVLKSMLAILKTYMRPGLNTRFNIFREREAEARSLGGESKFRPRKGKKSLCCTVLAIGLVLLLHENVA